MVVVLDRARQAIAGRALRIAYAPEGPGIEMLMGERGRPRYVRMTSGHEYVSAALVSGSEPTVQSGQFNVVTFVHYTDIPARGCDGAPRPGNVVLEYEDTGTGWTVKARAPTPIEPGGPVFDALDGSVQASSGPVKRIGDRQARAFVAPYKLPEGTMGGPPPGTTQSLWLDTETLVPLEWTIELPPDALRNAPALPEFGPVLVYDASIDLRPPRTSRRRRAYLRPQCF